MMLMETPYIMVPVPEESSQQPITLGLHFERHGLRVSPKSGRKWMLGGKQIAYTIGVSQRHIGHGNGNLIFENRAQQKLITINHY